MNPFHYLNDRFFLQYKTQNLQNKSNINNKLEQLGNINVYNSLTKFLVYCLFGYKTLLIFSYNLFLVKYIKSLYIISIQVSASSSICTVGPSTILSQSKSDRQFVKSRIWPRKRKAIEI